MALFVDPSLRSMTLTCTFSIALRHTRQRAGISQEELAELAELDRTYISQLERGLKSPTLTTLEKLASCLDIEAQQLLQEPRNLRGPRFPESYLVQNQADIPISRLGERQYIPTTFLTSAVNRTHDMIDNVYENDVDIAAILGLRNLSAFIGELTISAIAGKRDGCFQRNPHQDGYPDLLLMDSVGQAEWDRLEGQRNDKGPFSPFSGGGIEVKATCGSVPSPQQCRRKGLLRPDVGDTRIRCMTGYDWKAHHRETNNLLGILWDFIDKRPRIAAMFYCDQLKEEDWGRIVAPKPGGGRTTSVSIMSKRGIKKMYTGWLCVLSRGGYREFLNKRNNDRSISSPKS